MTLNYHLTAHAAFWKTESQSVNNVTGTKSATDKAATLARVSENKNYPMNPIATFEVELETENFFLVQTVQSHFDGLYVVASNPMVWEQHPERDRWKEPVFLQFFQKALENDLGCFTIIDKTKNSVVGSTRFYSFDSANDAIRLGYTFMDPSYWGTGANREIKNTLIDLAFSVVDKIFFDIGPDNHRSRAAVEKLGAVVAETSAEKVIYVLKRSALDTTSSPSPGE